MSVVPSPKKPNGVISSTGKEQGPVGWLAVILNTEYQKF